MLLYYFFDIKPQKIELISKTKKCNKTQKINNQRQNNDSNHKK